MKAVKNQRKIGFVLSYLSIFVSSFIGIAFTPYMITRLGKIDYGLYQVLHATIGYFALLDFGLGSTLTRFILKYRADGDEDKVNSAVSICLKIYVLIGVVVVAASFIGSLFLDRFFYGTIDADNVSQARNLFLIMGVTTGISFLRHAFSGMQSAGERYTMMKSCVIVQHVARVVLIYAFLNMGFGAEAVAGADLIVTALLLLVDIIYCRASMGFRLLSGRWDSALFKDLFSFSFFVFLQIIVVQVNNGLDRMLLGRYSNLEYVALYGVVMQLHGLFNSMGNVVCGVTLPQISKCVFSNPNEEQLTDKCVMYSRYQLLVSAMIMGGFLLYGMDFIKLWVPDYDTLAVYIVALLVVVPGVFESVEGTIFHVMKAKNLQAARSVILCCVVVANLFLTVFLTKKFPLYGAAIGTCVSFIVGNNILSNIYYHKKVGVNIPRYFKGLLKGIGPAWVLSLMIGFAIALIPVGGWLGFIIKGALYVAVYAVCMLLIGLNDSEKKMVYNVVGRLRRRSHVE